MRRGPEMALPSGNHISLRSARRTAEGGSPHASAEGSGEGGSPFGTHDHGRLWLLPARCRRYPEAEWDGVRSA